MSAKVTDRKKKIAERKLNFTFPRYFLAEHSWNCPTVNDPNDLIRNLFKHFENAFYMNTVYDQNSYIDKT